MPCFWYLTKSRCSIIVWSLNKVHRMCACVLGGQMGTFMFYMQTHLSVHRHVSVCSLTWVMDGCSIPVMWAQWWLVNNLINKVRYFLDLHWKCLLSFNGKSGVFTVGLFSLNLCQAHALSTWFDLVEDRLGRLFLLFTNQWFPVTIIGSSQPGTM